MQSELFASMSNREKSAWAALGTTAVIYTIYFATVVAGPMDQVITGQMLGRLIGAIVLQVIAMIVLHSVLAISSSSELVDERDAAIELRAEKFSSIVLSVGVVLTLLALMSVEVFRDSGEASRWPDLSPFVISHMLLLCLVISEVVKQGLEVFYYRRGI